MEKEYTREVQVEIGGETRRVLLCLWGLVLAEEKGYDISEVELDEEAEERKPEEGGSLGQMLDMLWIGMLPFEEDLERRELGMQVSFKDMEQISEAFDKIMSRQVTDDVREKIEEAQGQRAEGKASDGSKSS